jgi:hypothetical protein
MKIRAFTVFLLLLFCISFTYGQDIIKKHNGETIEALIVDISPGVIKYRKFDKPHGSVYSIARDQVEQITYQNGKTVVFEEEEKSDRPVKQDTTIKPPRPSPVFGWYLGMGGSSLYGDIEGAKMQLASTIGATLALPVGKNNTILLGFDILSLGCAFEDIDLTLDDGTRVEISNANEDLGYLGLVVMDRYFFNTKMNYFIEGGGYGSFLVNANYSGEATVTDPQGFVENGTFSEQINDFYRAYDFGLLAGIGGRIPLGKSAKWHILMEARFYYGLTDIADPDPAIWGLGWEDYRESNIFGLILVGVDIPTRSQD